MKIILENFKFYKGINEFTFSKYGISLLSGGSGAGKSTIFAAIHFALFGAGSRSLVGEGMLSASIDFGDICITRTMRPNTLSFIKEDEKLDGEVAQKEIERIFGVCFDFVSYIPQKISKTFLEKTSSERIEIIEKLIFSNDSYTPLELKKKCQKEQKAIEDEMHYLKGQQSTLMRVIKTLPTVPPAFSLLSDKESKQEAKRLIFLKNKKRIFEQVRSKITSSSRSLERMREKLATAKSAHSLDGVQSSIDEDVLREHIGALKELNSLKISSSTQEECTRTIFQCEEDIKLVKKYLKQIKIYQCPECNSHLKLSSEGSLVAEKESKNFDGTEKEVLENLFSDFNCTCPNELLKILKEEINDWTREFDLISAHSVAKLKLHGKIIEKLSLKDAQKYLENKILSREQHTTISVLEKGYAEEDEYLNYLKTNIPMNELEAGINEIDTLHEKQLQKELYEKRAEDYKRQQQLSVELATAANQIKHKMTQIGALGTLGAQITQTGADLIQSTLNKLTTLINQYILDIFDEPVFISFPLSDKGVLLEIIFNGFEFPYSALSGGEQARLNICFTLAFAVFFGAKVLLLDECTSHLDEELTEKVIRLIRNNATFKVVVIAHQITKGMFDDEICLRD